MTVINDFVPLPGYGGVYLKESGGFEFRNLPGVVLEYNDEDGDDDENYSTIMPAAFRPLGAGIEPDMQAFDYVHKDDFKARYGAAQWDLKNIYTNVVVDDDGDIRPVTTFSIAVSNGNELNVYDGIGIDSEVLPNTTKFVIADNQHQALDDHQRAFESADHDNESE